jgi:hypothetical protein
VDKLDEPIYGLSRGDLPTGAQLEGVDLDNATLTFL